MTRLTIIAYQTRIAIVVGIVFIISLFLLQIFFRFFLSALFVLFPPRPTKPNHQFGVLPALNFPPVASPSGELTFRLETIGGGLPEATATAVVYQMPKQSANLLGLTATQEFARKLNLDPNFVQESKNIYRFIDPNLIYRRMRYDIVSGNFILRYAYEQDTGIFAERTLPRDDQVINDSKSFLTTHKLYNNDLKNGSAKITYLKLTGTKLVPTTSLSQADAVRVDFFRQPVNGLPVLTPDPDEGQAVFVYSGSKIPEKKLIQVAYTHWPIDTGTVGTYSLRTPQEAWDDVLSGKRFVASYPEAGTEVTVRNVYLAYYDSFEPQAFLQPVYVFAGDGGFVAYVPAVARGWVGE